MNLYEIGPNKNKYHKNMLRTISLSLYKYCHMVGAAIKCVDCFEMIRKIFVCHVIIIHTQNDLIKLDNLTNSMKFFWPIFELKMSMLEKYETITLYS